jgi:hypothetical protein
MSKGFGVVEGWTIAVTKVSAVRFSAAGGSGKRKIKVKT